MSVGQISGPLLSKNLLRNGVDLSFETDLLYLDVNTLKVGIKNQYLSSELEVNQNTQTTNLIVDNTATIASIEFNSSSISRSTGLGDINLNALNAIVADNIATDNIFINDQKISISSPDTDLELRPTQFLQIRNNTDITGSLHVTSNISFDGTITFGNNNSDSISFNSDVSSDLIPSDDLTNVLGTDQKRWKTVWADTLHSQFANVGSLSTSANIPYANRTGNTYYVATNGLDTNQGNHPNSPFATIKKALTLATAGWTVHIFPGTYVEQFPLIVPTGVTVNGIGIRDVTIAPTVQTNYKDCFLLNGETTVSNLTIADFYGDSVNDTGYAFRFADNLNVQSRSPYVQNVSVITNTNLPTTIPTEGNSIYVSTDVLGVSFEPNTVTVTKEAHSEALVQSWVGKNLVAWLNDVAVYSIVGYISEPQDPTNLWQIQLGEPFDVNNEGWGFSIYPENPEPLIIGSEGYQIVDDNWMSFRKTSLPPFFNTTVVAGWILEMLGSLNTITSVIEDPNSSLLWRVYFDAPASTPYGVPIFSAPTQSQNITYREGKGALIDGSVALFTSKEASMLFHSCTFITPNADAITMQNGVRVEWLNSFTYFANRGLYAKQGTIGFSRLSTELVPAEIIVGPGSTLFGFTSNSVTLDKTFYSQNLVESLVGKKVVIDRYPNTPLFYTVLSIETEPSSPTLWRMTVDSAFPSSGWFKPISFYPSNALTFVFSNDIWDTTGNSIGEPWVAWFKTNLPPDFNTTVGPDWTVNLAGLTWVVDYVIQDPVNTNMWRIYFTTPLQGGVGIPVFSPPVTGTAKVYGAEIRSIGSANVYGNYGAVADGSSTLMYLINHNFAYIGAGTSSVNDPTVVISDNEAVELNNGRVYRTSINQSGDFKVGDVFVIENETGTVSINPSITRIQEQGSISITNGTDTVFIDSQKVRPNDIEISGNTIRTLAQNFNFVSGSNDINLQNNSTITGDLTISGNFSIDGTITLGNQTTDTLTFGTGLSQDLKPKTNNTYDLGSSDYNWKRVYSVGLELPSILVFSNEISSNSNQDIVFSGNDIGKVILGSLNVNDNTVSSSSDIILAPSDSLNINKSNALRLPTGTAVDRSVLLDGDLRFNSSTGYFQGKNINLGGIVSADTMTSLTAHPTDNTFNFKINGTTVSTLDLDALTVNKFVTGQITLDSNTIRINNNDLLIANGPTSYGVIVQGIKVAANQIINQTNDPLVLSSTGNGYIKISGTNGVVIPSGTISQRPSSTEVGQLRYNTETPVLEVYDGLTWRPAVGTDGPVTQEEVEELNFLYNLVLG